MLRLPSPPAVAARDQSGSSSTHFIFSFSPPTRLCLHALSIALPFDRYRRSDSNQGAAASLNEHSFTAVTYDPFPAFLRPDVVCDPAAACLPIIFIFLLLFILILLLCLPALMPFDESLGSSVCTGDLPPSSGHSDPQRLSLVPSSVPLPLLLDSPEFAFIRHYSSSGIIPCTVRRSGSVSVTFFFTSVGLSFWFVFFFVCLFVYFDSPYFACICSQLSISSLASFRRPSCPPSFFLFSPSSLFLHSSLSFFPPSLSCFFALCFVLFPFNLFLSAI